MKLRDHILATRSMNKTIALQKLEIDSLRQSDANLRKTLGQYRDALIDIANARGTVSERGNWEVNSAWLKAATLAAMDKAVGS